MSQTQKSVFGFLSSSPTARPVHCLELGFGRSATVWNNANDNVTYDRPEGHTFSLYLKGGHGTRRLDGHRGSGSPGAICILPQGCSSRWEITASFEFVHLYVPDGELRRAFAETFDRDARLMVVPEITFGEGRRLAGALDRLAQAIRADRHLLAEQAMTETIAHSFADPIYGSVRAPLVKGGLASHVRRRIEDYIDAELGTPIRLKDLALIAQLSEFHLQRMFRESYGVSPYIWLAHRRIGRAKSLLRSAEPIAQIAAACGFSSQSHLTRAFKAATGVTPAAYRSRI